MRMSTSELLCHPFLTDAFHDYNNFNQMQSLLSPSTTFANSGSTDDGRHQIKRICNEVYKSLSKSVKGVLKYAHLHGQTHVSIHSLVPAIDISHKQIKGLAQQVEGAPRRTLLLFFII